MATIYESEIEQLALDILRDENGYTVIHGPDLVEGANPERAYTDVILQARLRAAINRLNPHLPAAARQDAFKQALRTPALTLLDNNNEAFHRLLTEGVNVKFGVSDGKSRTDKAWLIDFAHPENNEFLAVNQVTVVESKGGSRSAPLSNRRPDILIFINGLPLIVIELKNCQTAPPLVQSRR